MSATPIVIDASLLAAYLLREPEGVKFDPILALATSVQASLHAPILIEYELLNILAMAERRGRITKNTAVALLHDWSQIPCSRDSSISPAIRLRILDLSQKHRLTAYDAAYLELAMRLDARLLTLDDDLLRLKRAYRFIE